MNEKDFSNKIEEGESGREIQERELSRGEIEGMGQDMAGYNEELKKDISESKTRLENVEDEWEREQLQSLLDELEENLEGLDLDGWVEDIETENYESVVTRPAQTPEEKAELLRQDMEKMKKGLIPPSPELLEMQRREEAENEEGLRKTREEISDKYSKE